MKLLVDGTTGSLIYGTTGPQGRSAFRALPAEVFGATLNAVFPGMGERAAYEQPEQFSADVGLSTVLEKVLEKVPVKLTTLTSWMRQHQEAFR